MEINTTPNATNQRKGVAKFDSMQFEVENGNVKLNVDDTPVNGETKQPVSSNWAYDHTAAADPHTGYRLESADHTHASTGAQAGQLDHGNANTAASLLDDDHTQYLLAAGTRALTGDWNIGAKAVDLLETLTDGQYSGVTCAGVAGATVAFGDLIYLSNTDRRWELADANAIGTSGLVELGICLSSGTDGTAINILKYGYVREDDWNWNIYNADQNMYVGETAGDMSQYVPLTDAAQVRVVGKVQSADSIFFNASPDNYEIDVTTGAAASVDIGAAASDRAVFIAPNGNTDLAVDNVANADGILDTVEIWANTNLSGCVVGTYYGSGTTYTNRDYAVIGAVTAGSKQTFTGLSIQVRTGDLLGVHVDSGNIDAATTGGAGLYYKAGDQSGTGAQTYAFVASYIFSVYASGVTKTNTIVSINGMDIA